ncbi:MAG: DNA methyltransferase [Nitrososphaerota archaeon]
MREVEFRSQLEDIMPAEELLFSPTPAFGKYRYLMPPESISHPAKFNTELVEFLVLKYTKEGDTILDCMAGSGVLGVIAAINGRNAVQVELEPRFYEWMEKARENVENMVTLSQKGRIVNILGDARRLSELISKADICITSPPYLKSADSGAGINRQREGDVKIGCSTIGRMVSHPEAVDNVKEYGSIDAIITSPPYDASLEGSSRHLRGGIASRDSVLAQTGTYATILSEATKKGVPICYSPCRENIGNLKSSDEEYEMLTKGLMKDGKPTYLSEMFKVYSEMFKVLKPGGYAIIVIKPFIRNKRVIDLPFHTYLLMGRVGFRLEKLYKLRLQQKSFWRILYFKKHPEVPQINHEYVLVMRKTLEKHH